jgi:ABC-type dipeptide/oligopeptide/nickel transport system permease subunit
LRGASQFSLGVVLGLVSGVVLELFWGCFGVVLWLVSGVVLGLVLGLFWGWFGFEVVLGLFWGCPSFVTLVPEVYFYYFHCEGERVVLYKWSQSANVLF